jgi:hypothetical protein
VSGWWRCVSHGSETMLAKSTFIEECQLSPPFW